MKIPVVKGRQTAPSPAPPQFGGAGLPSTPRAEPVAPMAVALMTDFGRQDAFVGTMKGVMLSKAPSARWVDLTHEIPPQDVRAAAFQLLAAYSYFPAGTLFVVVVDPGVGTPRDVLYAESERYRFLAPDNGVLSWVLSSENNVRARRVENPSLWLEPVSATFHGRDVFAPVAAALVRGFSPENLGRPARHWKKIPFPRPSGAGNRVKGEILLADHFGNLITNIRPTDLLRTASARRWRFSLQGNEVPWKEAYGSVPSGQPVAVNGSSGFIEISIRDGSAARRWNTTVGTSVVARQKGAGGSRS